MSNYTKTTDFEAKDSLPSGDSGKIIRGSEFETEFDNIATAIATKADAASPTFTGTVTIDGLTVNGNTTLGNAATDTVTVTADIASNLIPSADDTYNLGASGAEWNDLYVDGVAHIDSISDVIYVDSATSRVGIGTNSPSTLLHAYHATDDTVLKVESGDGQARIDLIDSGGTARVNSVGSDLRLEADPSNSVNNSTIDFKVDGTQVMRIDDGGNVGIGTTSPATALDVSGTVTADGLTVDGNATISGASNGLRLTETDTTDLNSYITNQAGTLRFRSANDAYDSFTTRLQLDHTTGDISFYEDTGTTAKFFWDASAESLGIGTNSPSTALNVVGTVTTDKVEIEGSGAGLLNMYRTGTNANFSAITFNNSANTATNAKIGWNANELRLEGTTQMTFNTNSNEAIRITNGGHLLVGKTAQDATNTVGFEAKDTGEIGVTTDGTAAAYFNRKTSDGTIAQFRKDNSAVGSIGTVGGDTYFEHGGTGVRLWDGNNAITPCGTSGATQDGTRDLGVSGARWKDLYLSGGVVFGTTGGNVSSKTLDDYEEGTFTPTVKGSTTEGTGTYSSIGGAYTKVGNRVMVNFNINMTAHDGAGNIEIDLPFAANSSAVGTIMDQNFNYGSGTKLVSFAQSGATLKLYAVGDNVPWDVQTLGDDNGFVIFGSITYRTSA